MIVEATPPELIPIVGEQKVIRPVQYSNRNHQVNLGRYLIYWLGLWLTPVISFGSGLIAILGEGPIVRGFISAVFFGCAGSLIVAGLTGYRFGYGVRVLTVPAVFFVLAYGFSLAVSVSSIESLNADFAIPLFKVMLSVAVVFFVSEQDWNNPNLLLSHLVFGVVVLGFDLALVLIGRGNDQLVFGQMHENSVALFGFIGVIFGFIGFFSSVTILHQVMSVFLAIEALLCVAMTRGRSVMIALVVSGFVTWLLRRWEGSRALRKMLIVFLALICFAIPSVYTNLDTVHFFDDVDRLSESWFGKSLLTGRQKLWPIVLEDIYERPWFGYGVESRKRWEWQELGSGATKLSAHNSYLTILHEAGIVGLVGFAVYIVAIWASLIRFPGSFQTRLCSGFFWAALLQQTFEVSLINGDYRLAICIWSVVGCGLSFVDSYLEEPDEEIEETGNDMEDALFSESKLA